MRWAFPMKVLAMRKDMASRKSPQTVTTGESPWGFPSINIFFITRADRPGFMALRSWKAQKLIGEWRNDESTRAYSCARMSWVAISKLACHTNSQPYCVQRDAIQPPIPKPLCTWWCQGLEKCISGGSNSHPLDSTTPNPAPSQSICAPWITMDSRRMCK